MKLTFLGTGTSQGVPVIACDCDVCKSLDFRDKRLRSSVYIELEDLKLVIDTGPDFRQQMLVNQIQKVDAVLFTHEHKDHIAGLDDVRAYNFKYEMDMPIYATERVLKQIKSEYHYIFADNPYPGIPRIVANPITLEPFSIGKNKIHPIEVMHHKLPVTAFRIKDLAYVTDANFISDEEKKKLQNLDVLILNALRIDKHISHYNLEEALELVKELKPKKTYFTHISHYLGQHAKIDAKLPSNVFLAYDGFSMDF